MINVVILESKTFLVDRFSGVLSKWDFVKETSVFQSSLDFQQAMMQFFYDVLLVDLDFSDDSMLDVIRSITKLHPKTAVIAISEKSDPETVLDCVKAGVSGYLLKDDSTFGVKTAITEVLNRGAPISPTVALHLLKRLSVSSNPGIRTQNRQPSLNLTKRESDVIGLFAKGLTTKEVSLELGMSEKTVPVHLRNIYKKLGTSNRKQAVIKAQTLGLIH
ncbi:LuxR C-terminal-related transcriptional regulator [Cypionkella sp.]|uniref:LuxR C-terminal-related transcriptional regulator n=1 Tax=Cypionkella sp. TaxID=2811411 RepID=UPI003750576B